MVSEHTARHKFSANLLAYTFSRLLRDGIARDRFRGDLGLELGEAAFKVLLSEMQHHDPKPSNPQYLNPKEAASIATNVSTFGFGDLGSSLSVYCTITCPQQFVLISPKP